MRNESRRRGLVTTRSAAILGVVTVVVVSAALVVRLPGAPADSGQPVLRAYPVSGPNLAEVHRQLQSRFGQSADVRIAADARSHQILLWAPASVHAEVAQFLSKSTRQPPSPATREDRRPVPSRPARPERRPKAPPPPPASLPLEHISSHQLELSLAQLWGRRLPVSVSADGEWGTVPLKAPSGQPAALHIHRRENRVHIEGPDDLRRSWIRLIRALDRVRPTDDDQTEVLPLANAERDQVRYVLTALQRANTAPPHGPVRRTAGERPSILNSLAQLGGEAPPAAPAQTPADDTVPAPNAEVPGGDAGGRPPAAENGEAAGAPPAEPGAADGAAAGPAAAEAAPGPAAAAAPGDQSANLIGPVQIELIDGLDVVIVRGHRRDVERVVAIIEQIEQLSAETEPRIVVLQLQHADSQPLTEIVGPLYAQTLAPRSGQVSMTALVKPNAILLIGRPEAVESAEQLIRRLDQPVEPDTQFKVFPLRYAVAEEVVTTITEFYEERGGLGPRVRVTADFRTNAVIAQASPRDLVEIGALIADIDVAETPAENELRVFRLKNSLADELAPILQEAINGQGTRTGVTGAQPGGQTNRTEQLRSTMLTFLSIDAEGGKLLKSGILTDVRITADSRANALLVTAPTESMPLIAAIIEQLDALPSAVAQIKVFTIANGDAINMAEMLSNLFEEQTGDLPTVLAGAGPGDTSLVPLAFSVDERTNSIIASGSAGDLAVVEAILLRLDESDISQRESIVFRLHNAPAADVAAAINELLQSERQVEQVTIEQISPFRQIEREVIVVPEPITNSLIISATPRFFEEIMDLVEDLDKRPPMVVIQVLLALVRLGDVEELGVEFGLQDSLLFDRSLGLGTDALLTPGFLFNNQTLGNSGSATSLATRSALAGQGLSSFAVGRENPDLGYGGLVLSASSESISVLVRALQQCSRLQVLSRPQVMTLDNQSAFVQVGQRVPRVTSVQTPTGGGTISNTTLENVGILLGVTPRISPDGLVVMEIDAERSQLSNGPGIPIGTSEGQVIESPIVDIATAQTTVSAVSGQTIIIGGLISTDSVVISRKVPFLGDVPIAGHLFRYDSVEEERNELLIIMTPHIVKDEADAEWVKQMESQRMSWCLADVVDVHGEGVLSGTTQVWNESWDEQPTDVIHPDRSPSASPEPVPVPVPVPAQPDDAIPAPTGQGTSAPPGPRMMPRAAAAQPPQPLHAHLPADDGSQVRFRAPNETAAVDNQLGMDRRPPPAVENSPANRWQPVRDPAVRGAGLQPGTTYPDRREMRWPPPAATRDQRQAEAGRFSQYGGGFQ